MKLGIAAITVGMILFDPGVRAAAGESESRAERVEFTKGASTKVIKGAVKGREHVDYRLRAGAGQTLTVTLKPTHPSNYFNVNPPESEQSLFVGSTSGGEFTGTLPADGDYTVRVYLMRSAARRNESSRYTLNVGLTGRPLVALPAKADALIPGTPYHASATVPCAYYLDPKVNRCEAFVIRRGHDGTATVEVRWPIGTKRRILFMQGKAVASDSPDPLAVSRQGDTSSVSMGSAERVEIADALIFGG